MKIKFSCATALKKSNGLIVMGCFSDLKTIASDYKVIDGHANNAFSSLRASKGFSSVAGKYLAQYPGSSSFSSGNMLFNLGTRKETTYSHIRNLAGDAIRFAKTHAISSIDVLLPKDIYKSLDANRVGQALLEGLHMGAYAYDALLSKSEKAPAVSITVLTDDASTSKALQAGSKEGQIVGESVCFSRDLINAPANLMTPAHFVAAAKKCLKGVKGVKINVFDQKKAKSLSMNAFLGVAQGSANPPYFLELSYLPNKKEAPICLVGKGVTFDSGGISIKPSKGMSGMKADMSGAANTFSAFSALAKLGTKRNVVALIPLVENMPSGHAQRPGDVVTAMNGKSIEIVNTDAEGRLILADALSYAVAKVKPSQIIDMATLTGASIIALGHAAAAILGNNDAMIDAFRKASDFTGEKVWQLPLYEEYLAHLKSDVADICHANEGREAGTCTAAKFLEQFVDDIPWVHLDIACVMAYKATSGAKVKGMSAEGMMNLVEYIRNA